MTLTVITAELDAQSDTAQAANLSRFFKTGPGQYGEGDRFRGIKMPVLRALSKKFRDAPMKDTLRLLKSPWHEDRMLALLILVLQFQKGPPEAQEEIYRAYLANTARINNWDLIDLTAPHIVGGYLLSRDRTILYALASSKSLWERRIAVLATFHFIYRGEWQDTWNICAMLLDDKQDLMHKAVGWMLREVGKRVSRDVLRNFLTEYSSQMPRTALRYAIEHLSETERKKWMAKP